MTTRPLAIAIAVILVAQIPRLALAVDSRATAKLEATHSLSQLARNYANFIEELDAVSGPFQAGGGIRLSAPLFSNHSGKTPRPDSPLIGGRRVQTGSSLRPELMSCRMRGPLLTTHETCPLGEFHSPRKHAPGIALTGEPPLPRERAASLGAGTAGLIREA